jgi:hypothetical protein
LGSSPESHRVNSINTKGMQAHEDELHSGTAFLTKRAVLGDFAHGTEFHHLTKSQDMSYVQILISLALNPCNAAQLIV